MAGMPKRRGARMHELTEHAPHVQAIALPDDWHARSIADRLETNLGLSIDQCFKILSTDFATATPGERSAIKEVALAYTNASFKHIFSRQRDQAREQALQQLASAMSQANGSRPDAKSHAESATIATPVCAEAEQAPAPKLKRKRNQ